MIRMQPALFEIVRCIFPTQQEPCCAQTRSGPAECLFEVEFQAKIEQTCVDRSGFCTALRVDPNFGVITADKFESPINELSMESSPSACYPITR